jgi:transposase
MSQSAGDNLQALRDLAASRGASLAVWRARIVLAHLEGQTYREVSERFGCSQATVAKWVRRHREEGVGGLEDRERSTTLGPRQRMLQDWLPEVVRRGPSAYGVDRSRWTLKALQSLFERHFGDRPALETIRRELRELDLRL